MKLLWILAGNNEPEQSISGQNRPGLKVRCITITASQEPGTTRAKWRGKCEWWGTQRDEIQRMMGHILKTFPDPIKWGLDAATTMTVWRRWKTPPSWPHSWRVTVLRKWLFNKNNSLFILLRFTQLGASSQQLDRCNKCDVTKSRVRNMSCQGPAGNIREPGPGGHRVIRDRGEERIWHPVPGDGVISVWPNPVINPCLYIGCNVRKRVILWGLITVLARCSQGRPGLRVPGVLYCMQYTCTVHSTGGCTHRESRSQRSEITEITSLQLSP